MSRLTLWLLVLGVGLAVTVNMAFSAQGQELPTVVEEQDELYVACAWIRSVLESQGEPMTWCRRSRPAVHEGALSRVYLRVKAPSLGNRPIPLEVQLLRTPYTTLAVGLDPMG